MAQNEKEKEKEKSRDREKEKEQPKAFGHQEFSTTEKEEIDGLLKQKLGKTYVSERKGAGGGNFAVTLSGFKHKNSNTRAKKVL